MNALGRIVTLLMLQVTLGYPATARAQALEADPSLYVYHPTSILTLGAGFSPNDLSRPRRACVNFERQPFETAALNTNFSVTLVTNSEQLKQSLNLDAKVDASYLAFKGGNQFTLKYENIFNARSATVVLTARTEFGRLGMRSYSLESWAEAALADGVSFERMCGSRFVAIERRGASVSTVITIGSMSQEVTTALTAKMSGSGGWGELSAEAMATFQAELKKASTSGRARFQMVATGGNGFGDLGEVIPALAFGESPIGEIQKALGKYLSQFNAENAAPVAFHVMGMDKAFGWNPNSVDLWSEQKERRLRRLVETYRKTELRLDIARNLLQGTDPRVNLITDRQRAEIESAADLYEEYLDKLAATHKACRETPGANLAACVPPEVRLPPESIIPAVPGPPQVSVLVKADDETLDEATSRLILTQDRFIDGIQEGGLLRRTRNFRSRAREASVLIRINGAHLLAADLTYIVPPPSLITSDEDRLLVKETIIKRFTLRGGENTLIFDQENTDEDIIRWIRRWQLGRSGNVNFVLRVHDRIGGEHDMHILSSWFQMKGVHQSRISERFIIN